MNVYALVLSKLARFDNIHPGLTCDHALHLLMKPVNEQDSESDFYTAAAHLINCPSDKTQQALIEFLECRSSSNQSVKIAKRKIVEVLARLGAVDAIAAIGKCLWSDDQYLVENTVWSLQRLHCQDEALIDKMIALLEANTVNQRVIIQCLASLNVAKSLDVIHPFQFNAVPGIQGAAIAAVSRLTNDSSRVCEITKGLLLPNQMDRHCAIQDLIDAQAVDQLGEIFSAPVSPVFKTRALRQIYEGRSLENIEPNMLSSLDSVLSCDLSMINYVHQYDTEPSAEFLIQELYNTDFGRCYLALKYLYAYSSATLFPALKVSWLDEAHNDYGAHYFFAFLFGAFSDWPEGSQAWIFETLLSSIFNLRPQFQKSRAAAVISLSKLNPSLLCESLPNILSGRDGLPWDMRYCLIYCLDHYISMDKSTKDDLIMQVSDGDRDDFVLARARMALA